MSKPQIHTFGVAKYVYAAAYDQIEAERDALLAAIPEGCTPADARVLRHANHALADELADVKAERDALKATLNHVWPIVSRYLVYKGHAPEANTLHDIAVIIKAGDDA